MLSSFSPDLNPRKSTQKEVVRARIERIGVVHNFWAFNNYILRLGAIIFELRREGMKLEGSFGTGKNKKNYYYRLIK